MDIYFQPTATSNCIPFHPITHMIAKNIPFYASQKNAYNRGKLTSNKHLLELKTYITKYKHTLEVKNKGKEKAIDIPKRNY